MNKQIKQFERQSGLDVYCLGLDKAKWESRLEAYTQLIVGECVRKIEDIAESSNDPQPIYRVAVELLEHFGVEE